MLWVCVGDVMDVVFSVYIVTHEAVSVSSCRCCVLCASCGSACVCGCDAW